MRTAYMIKGPQALIAAVGMKPLSERDENNCSGNGTYHCTYVVGMKPLSERDENSGFLATAVAMELTT